MLELKENECEPWKILDNKIKKFKISLEEFL
jgi:hypothetical protein